MNSNISKLLQSIDNEIKSAIMEQFNISGMDLNGSKPNHNVNIFNKNIINPEEIFNMI